MACFHWQKGRLAKLVYKENAFPIMLIALKLSWSDRSELKTKDRIFHYSCLYSSSDRANLEAMGHDLQEVMCIRCFVTDR